MPKQINIEEEINKISYPIDSSIKGKTEIGLLKEELMEVINKKISDILDECIESVHKRKCKIPNTPLKERKNDWETTIEIEKEIIKIKENYVKTINPSKPQNNTIK